MTNASGCIFLEVGNNQSEVNGHAIGYVELELSFALELHMEMKREGQTWPIVRLRVGDGLSRPLVKDFRRIFPVICIEPSFLEAGKRHAAFLAISGQLRHALIPRVSLVPRPADPGRCSILSVHRVKTRLALAALSLLVGGAILYKFAQIPNRGSVPTYVAPDRDGLSDAPIDALHPNNPSAVVPRADVEKVEHLAKDPSANLGRTMPSQYTRKDMAAEQSGPARTLKKDVAELR